MDIFITVWLCVMVVMSALGAAFMFHFCNTDAGQSAQHARRVRGMSMMVGFIWIFVGLVSVSKLMVKGCL